MHTDQSDANRSVRKKQGGLGRACAVVLGNETLGIFIILTVGLQ